MSIRKFRASRVNTTNANIYVGQNGDMFYDEDLGQLKISDGHTPGGSLVFGAATTTKLGGIKAGPGANVSVDGTLTIDTTGIPLSIGDLYITQANISTVNANENLNLISNGTGAVNIVGNLHIHTPAQGPDYPVPILQADNSGNVTVNGNLITNGKSYFYGNVVEIGNLTVTGNTVNNGVTTFNGPTIINGSTTRTGDTVQSGNVTITGNSVNTGSSTFNGLTTFNGNVTTTGNLIVTGNTAMVGNVVQQGNLTINGTTINNGLSIFNGNLAMIGNAVIAGNTTVTGIATLTGNSYITGNTFVTGTTNVTGNLISQGGSTTILAPNILSGTAGALNIVGSADGTYMPVTGAGGMIHITGNPDSSARITVDGWTTSATDPQPATAIGAGLITLRASRGTPASPLPTKAGDHLGTIAALGKVGNTTGYSQGQTGLLFYAAEDYTSNVAVGSFANIQVVPTGSNVAVTSAQFFANGISTLGLTSLGSVVAVGNVTAANVNATLYGNVVGTSATLTGNVTAANVNATLYGNVVGTSATLSGNLVAGNVTAQTLFHGNAVGSNATYTNTVTANTVNTGAQVITNGGIKTVIGGTPTITLNFGTDSIVFVYQPTGTVTFQYGTLVAGATITCWVNMATARNIATGATATNNTTLGGFINIGGGGNAPAAKNNETVQLVYTCVDGTAANTYLAATYG